MAAEMRIRLLEKNFSTVELHRLNFLAAAVQTDP